MQSGKWGLLIVVFGVLVLNRYGSPGALTGRGLILDGAALLGATVLGLFCASRRRRSARGSAASVRWLEDDA